MWIAEACKDSVGLQALDFDTVRPFCHYSESSQVTILFWVTNL